jgi:spore coat polysaccharide biosynthesis protein SpsF (cytidylyltransferase family)
VASSSNAARPLVVVQARIGSERLPGKVLADLGGRPVLAWLLDRVGQSRTTAGIVVATADGSADDPVAALAEAWGAQVVRGHSTDVLARFISVLDATAAASIVRISADSPFLDAATVDTIVADFERGGADLVQNHRRPGWPVGTAVEVITAECLRLIDAATDDPRLREHVTLHAYEHPDDFEIRHVRAPPELEAPELRLCVDTAEDLEHARRISASFEPNREFALADVVARFGRPVAA